MNKQRLIVIAGTLRYEFGPEESDGTRHVELDERPFCYGPCRILGAGTYSLQDGGKVTHPGEVIVGQRLVLRNAVDDQSPWYTAPVDFFNFVS